MRAEATVWSYIRPQRSLQGSGLVRLPEATGRHASLEPSVGRFGLARPVAARRVASRRLPLFQVSRENRSHLGGALMVASRPRGVRSGRSRVTDGIQADVSRRAQR